MVNPRFRASSSRFRLSHCRALLAGAGLVVAAPGAGGLYVRLCRQGTIIGWRDGLPGSGPPAAPQPAAPQTPGTDVYPATPPTPGSGGVTFTLSVLLEKAGYRTPPHGGDLLDGHSPQ